MVSYYLDSHIHPANSLSIALNRVTVCQGRCFSCPVVVLSSMVSFYVMLWCYAAYCYTVALLVVVFDLSHSLVYVSRQMSSQFANLQSAQFQSVIFQSVIFQSCKFSYPRTSLQRSDSLAESIRQDLRGSEKEGTGKRKSGRKEGRDGKD